MVQRLAGDDDVVRSIGQRQIFDVAFDELEVVDALGASARLELGEG